MDEQALAYSQFFHRVTFYLHKAIVVALSAQALYALFISVHFIFIQYPQLEQQLATHQIESSYVNQLANRAILSIISMVLSLFFALRISALHSETARKIDAFLGMMLVIANTQLENMMALFGSEELLPATLINFLKSLWLK